MEIANWVPAVGEEIMIAPDVSTDMPLVTRFMMTEYAGDTVVVDGVDEYVESPIYEIPGRHPRRMFCVYAGGFWWPACAVMPVSPLPVRSENDLDDLLGLAPENEL